MAKGKASVEEAAAKGTATMTPPKVSGDDLLKEAGEFALENPEAFAPIPPVEAPRVEPLFPGEPNLKKSLDGWVQIDRCKDEGVVAIERHKSVSGGTLVWLSRFYHHPIAGKGVGTDCIAFVPDALEFTDAQGKK